MLVKQAAFAVFRPQLVRRSRAFAGTATGAKHLQVPNAVLPALAFMHIVIHRHYVRVSVQITTSANAVLFLVEFIKVLFVVRDFTMIGSDRQVGPR